MACKARSPKKRHLKRSKYKLRNWKKYTASLKARGSLIIWIDPTAESNWYYKGDRKAGGKIKYSDMAIQMNLQIRSIYYQPLRQAEGMIESIIKMMGMQVSVPDYTTVCRRAQKLALKLERFQIGEGKKTGGTVYMIIDSTGLKVYGAGEWHVKKHGINPRRKWKKMHVSVGTDGDIQAVTVTDQYTDDASQVSELQDQMTETVDGVVADGAYDSHDVYESFLDKNTDSRIIIPPRSTAVMSEDAVFKQRNEHIYYIQEHGREAWEDSSGYTKQARSENTMFRYKLIFGGHLRSRTDRSQETEVTLNCSILNKMASLGMPDSYKVA